MYGLVACLSLQSPAAAALVGIFVPIMLISPILLCHLYD